jgi:hypothetical protein
MDAFYFKVKVILKQMTSTEPIGSRNEIPFSSAASSFAAQLVCGFWWIWWVGHPGAAHHFFGC